MTHLEELRAVIRRLHGADATHVESVPVKEVYQGKTVWEGSWKCSTYGGIQKRIEPMPGHTTPMIRAGKGAMSAVLHAGPVTSAALAVRGAIVQEFRNAKAEEV